MNGKYDVLDLEKANPIVCHYYEDEDKMRIRLKSNGDFRGGALCGNGNAHAKTTHKIDKVTCEKCKSIINKNELYYRN